MARPKKENADYHTHDKDMRNDPKIRALRKRYGHEGYAVFNMMLEVLTDSDSWVYPWNEMNIEVLSGDFDSENMEEIIKYCTEKLKLFVIENGVIYSLQHQKRFKPLLSKRKRDLFGVFDSENPHSKVKYSKVKESKGVCITDAPANSILNNEKIQSENGLPGDFFIPPDFEQVSDFFFKKLKNNWDGSKCNLVAQKFYNHYKGLGWRTSSGASVEDWMALANKWILDDLEAERTNKPYQAKAPPVFIKPKPPDEGDMKILAEVTYWEFKQGVTIEPDIPSDLYDFLVAKQKIVLTGEQRGNILQQCDGNGQLAKKKSVALLFSQLQKDNADKVFE